MRKRTKDNRIDTRGRESANISDVHLLIEPTDFCNCRCIMCKQSHPGPVHGNIPKQHMDFSLFVKILEDIKESGFHVTSIDPLWTGESTMHPDFKEMLYYLFTMNKDYNLFRGFVLNTNAINMDEELSDILLDYARYVHSTRNRNFFRLYFSIDAATSATYQKIRNISGENLDKVVKNISYLVKNRKELGIIIPNLIFIFIVMQENLNEAGVFRDLCGNILKDSGVPYEIVPTWPLLVDRDSIYHRQLISCEPEKAEEIHRKAVFKLGLTKDALSIPLKRRDSHYRLPCGALWRTPNIASSGNIVPCCRDIDLSLVLGNVKNDSLYDIWHGEKITEMRLLHIKGEFEKISTCSNCVEPEGGVLSDDEIMKYLDSVNRPELMKIYAARKHE